jgi:predicted Rossmann-fold nucleotide-binding protein
VLNIADYYSQLAAFFDHQVRAGFVDPEHREMLLVAEDGDALLDAFESYEPPNVRRFITEDRQT